MIVLLFILTLYAFSVAGSMDSGVRNAFRGAMYVLVSCPFMSIGLSLLMVILIFVMSITVLPMLLIGPALVASIVNRFTLTILGEEIIDPSSPTTERQDERSRGVNPDQTILTRLRGNSRSRNGQ
jgi:ABC-type transport system involved in multi-copper enzyme maturation permease subunit